MKTEVFAFHSDWSEHYRVIFLGYIHIWVCSSLVRGFACEGIEIEGEQARVKIPFTVKWRKERNKLYVDPPNYREYNPDARIARLTSWRERVMADPTPDVYRNHITLTREGREETTAIAFEWLKANGHLKDIVTGPPTLTLVPPKEIAP